jgi:hypothetical protein
MKMCRMENFKTSFILFTSAWYILAKVREEKIRFADDDDEKSALQ